MSAPAGAPGSGVRIASLVPSITELLVTLGLRPWLVARTGFCIHPREALADVPKVGGTKDVKLERLRVLAPTHVIVNVDENEKPTVDALRTFVPEVIVTHPCAPQDNLELYAQMARHFGHLGDVARQADMLARRLAQALARAGEAAHDMAARRVLYLIWRDPWMTVARDTYISRTLAVVNWQTWPEVHGGATGATRYPLVDWHASDLRQLDAVLLSSEPYRFTGRDVTAVGQLLAAQGARAQVLQVDGEALSWYGSRAIDGLDYLTGLARSMAAAPLPGGG